MVHEESVGADRDWSNLGEGHGVRSRGRCLWRESSVAHCRLGVQRVLNVVEGD